VLQARMRNWKIATAQHCRKDPACVYPAIRDGWPACRDRPSAPAPAIEHVDYKTTPDWEKAALGFTGGHGVEVGSAVTLARSFGTIRVGGKISMIGGLSGPATELNPGLIFARRANVQGISVGLMQMFEAAQGEGPLGCLECPLAGR